MSERAIAAQEFVHCFEALRQSIGDRAALLDSRVQGARRRYLAACMAPLWLLAA